MHGLRLLVDEKGASCVAMIKLGEPPGTWVDRYADLSSRKEFKEFGEAEVICFKVYDFEVTIKNPKKSSTKP